jgi:hypothetical protein
MCCDCSTAVDNGVSEVSLIEYLYDNGAVPDKIFSFALRDIYNDTGDSFIDFGWADTSAMVDSSALTYIPVYNDDKFGYGQYWWQAELTGIRFRPQVTTNISYDDSVTAAQEYSTIVNQVFTITDTGTSLLYLPTGIYEMVL